MLQCLVVALIRSNMITHITIVQWTETQCAIGYFSHHTLIAICKAFMYNLFNHRIKIIFQNNPAYAYNNKLYLIMYVIPWYSALVTILCLFMIMIEVGDSVNVNEFEWNLNKDQGSYMTFCDNEC